MKKKILDANHHINYWVIIPAAGSGMRMNSKTPKQYLKLNNQETIVHSINIFLTEKIFSKIVIVLAPDDNYFKTLDIYNDNRIITSIGGSQRYISVFNGIKEIQKTQKYSLNDWILVHDAARPCLNKNDIHLLINNLQNKCIGSVLGYPASNSMKVIDNKQNIQHSLNRNTLWHAVTPQIFKMGILLDSLEYCIKQNISVTDEASAVESLGYKPKIFCGSIENIKVTTPEDILLAEYYLQKNRERKEGSK